MTEDTDTVGFTCPPNFLMELLSMVSVENEFPDVVLNFDNENKKVWWVNNGKSLANFGFFSYDYLENCWGNSNIILTISTLLYAVKCMQKYEKCTFSANLKTKIIRIQAGDIDSELEIHASYIPNKCVRSALPKIPVEFDADYIPIHHDKASQWLYGGDFDVSELKWLIKAAKRFGSYVPLYSREEALKAIFKEPPYTLTNCTKTLIPIETAPLKLPEKDIEHTIENEIYKSAITSMKPQTIIKNKKRIKGHTPSVVTLRFSGNNRPAIYLMKKDTNGSGSFVSGIIIETMTK